jgi:23S rRNA pseudouridine2605 synthase
MRRPTIPQPSRKIGLARALSKLGWCSRSRASELIREGRVSLNGTMRRDPEAPVSLAKDIISVDETRVRAETRVYLVMNKPCGVVTTASDERGRKTVYEFVTGHLPWVSPVGRLDKASEGLLLLTNDSEWADRLLAPETHLDKTYHVQVAAVAEAALLHAIIAGAKVGNETLRVKTAAILRGGEKNTWLEVVLDEGKNRQIRRIFEHFGIEVLRLVRVAIGPLALGNLRKGSVRPLTQDEKLALDRCMNVSKSGARFLKR